MKKIFFFECQYDSLGAMNVDQLNIKRGLKKKYDLVFINFKNPSFNQVRKKIQKLKKNDLIIFLSIRISILFLISIFFYSKKFICIYHFVPRHRYLLHKYLMKIMNNVYFAVHSFALKEQIEKIFNLKEVAFVPNRLLFYNKTKKKNVKSFNIFIPKFSEGKNLKLNLNKYLKKFTMKKIKINQIYLQGGHDIKNLREIYKSKIISLIDDLNFEDYYNVLKKSHYMIKLWNKKYEIRCSSTILDCLQYDLIFLTNIHPINNQYAINRSLVALKSLSYGNLIKTYKNNSIKYKYYFNADSFINLWDNLILKII